jgi:hypothetical protein
MMTNSLHKAIRLEAYSRNRLCSYYTVIYSQHKRASNSLGKPQECKKKKKKILISLVGIAIWLVPCTVIPSVSYLDHAVSLLWIERKQKKKHKTQNRK